MDYKPLELLSTPKEWDSLEDLEDEPRENPFTNFDGLEVKLAIVRPPNYGGGKKCVTSSRAVFQFLQPELADEYVESMLCLILDSGNCIRSVYIVARGSVASVEVYPADIIRAVLAAGSNAFIIVHNHPSGRPEPSQSDMALTRNVQSAASCVGLQLLDHIIIGEERYVSLADRGEL
jgi:DNA repair protein RadC